MAESSRCAKARAVLQQVVAGIAVPAEDVDEALAHIAACPDCGVRFGLGPTAAFSEWNDATPAMPEPHEPIGQFERVLNGALSNPEAIVRMRAAQRLGSYPRVGTVALDGLAGLVAEDDDAEVRETALGALDRLDKDVSLPQRLIESWSATPAEAVPYLSDVLARLADPAVWASPNVTGLVASGTPSGLELSIVGPSGESGRITQERANYWLSLRGLSSQLEDASPMLAVPKALEANAPSIHWSGERPGLVPAQLPVAGGSLDLHIGNAPDLDPMDGGLPAGLFDHVYLLNPREHTGGI